MSSLTQALSLYSTEKWEIFGDRLKTYFHLQEGESVRPYKGLGPALIEITMTTAQFFAHKRSVAFCRGFAPWIDDLLPYYLKEAYQIQNYEPAQFLKQDEAYLNEWIQNLKKDTLFVVACENHPVTGEIYNLDRLDQLLNEKKIFFIRLSSVLAPTESLKLSPYSIRVFSYGNDLALGFFGAKVKALPLVSHKMHWSDQQLSPEQWAQPLPFMSSEVEIFESSLPEFKFNFQTVNRLNDRLLLHFPEISADRMMKAIAAQADLQKELKLSAEQIQNDLWSANSCFHDSHFVEWKWWFQGPQAHVRGQLVLFGPTLLKSKQLPQILKALYKDLKSQQSWTY